MTHPRSLKDNSLGGYYDDEGDFQVDSSGIEKLSEALKSNSTLQTLEYAVACFHSYRQRPLTPLTKPLLLPDPQRRWSCSRDQEIAGRGACGVH